MSSQLTLLLPPLAPPLAVENINLNADLCSGFGCNLKRGLKLSFSQIPMMSIDGDFYLNVIACISSIG